MRQLVLILLTLIKVTCFGQSKDSIDSKHIFVQEPIAYYPGGITEMHEFIKKNLEYPKNSRGIEGKVFIEFMVNEDGSLSDFKVMKGLSESFDKNALEVVRKMPNWIPAKRDNKPIRTKMVIQIASAIEREGD